MRTLQERVEAAISAGFKVADLAKAAGTTSSAVSQWRSGETKTLKAASLLGLQLLTGWSAEWWMTGRGPNSGVAQPASQYSINLLPQTVAWEALMLEPLPAEFTTVLIDDAMAPFAPAGSVVKFRRQAHAEPGDAALVSDVNGAMYFREFRIARPGSWQAWAANPAYPTLEAEAHGLRVIAVFAGIDTTWAKLTQPHR